MANVYNFFKFLEDKTGREIPTMAYILYNQESIPEEGKKWTGTGGKKNVAEEDILGDLKKKKGGAAAGGSTYQFNQRAYKKYHSTRSLVERILKSHSEGNRFIRNEDL